MNAMLLAQVFHVRRHFLQVVPRQSRKEVMLNLPVEPACEPIIEEVTLDVPSRSYLGSDEISGIVVDIHSVVTENKHDAEKASAEQLRQN